MAEGVGGGPRWAPTRRFGRCIGRGRRTGIGPGECGRGAGPGRGRGRGAAGAVGAGHVAHRAGVGPVAGLASQAAPNAGCGGPGGRARVDEGRRAPFGKRRCRARLAPGRLGACGGGGGVCDRRGSAESSRMRGGAGERGAQNRLRRRGRRGAPSARRQGDPSHESSVERIMPASGGKRDGRMHTGMPPSRWRDSNPRRRQRRSMHRPEKL